MDHHTYASSFYRSSFKRQESCTRWMASWAMLWELSSSGLFLAGRNRLLCFRASLFLAGLSHLVCLLVLIIFFRGESLPCESPFLAGLSLLVLSALLLHGESLFEFV